MRIFIVTLVFLVVGGFFSSLIIKQYNSKRHFQALKHLPRENIQLATNFGIVKMDLNNVGVCLIDCNKRCNVIVIPMV